MPHPHLSCRISHWFLQISQYKASNGLKNKLIPTVDALGHSCPFGWVETNRLPFQFISDTSTLKVEILRFFIIERKGLTYPPKVGRVSPFRNLTEKVSQVLGASRAGTRGPVLPDVDDTYWRLTSVCIEYLNCSNGKILRKEIV
jgi:hypothetical protein